MTSSTAAELDPLATEPAPIAWRPQAGPQHWLVKCPYPEIFFGGARGGGKTDGILGKWALKERRYGKHFNGVFFRKEMPQQDDLIERAKEIYCSTGAVWKEGDKRFVMPHGGRVRFRALETVQDAEKYQGQNVSDAAVEEAGNYPLCAPIDMLFGCLRSAHGVPTQLILSANPGGPGHQWLKHRYIDPAPAGMTRLVRALENGDEHFAIYIPSVLEQNQILMRRDPKYASRLQLVGAPELVRAWLKGDWSVIAGAFFPEFMSSKHVVRPFELPKHWARIRCGDWGSARPFCFLWLAVSDGSLAGVPRGALVVYRELYGWNGKPNEGCQLPANEVGVAIREAERLDVEEGIRCTDQVIDPATFNRDGGPSIVERMGPYFGWRRADNARIGRLGAMGGWDQVRERLRGTSEGPQLLIFQTCVHLIRTLPALPHDPHRAEDVCTAAEDHACFAAGTLVDGEPIEKVGQLTRSATRVVRLEFEDGRHVVCTPDHQFLTEQRSWRSADQLLWHRVWSAPRFRNSMEFGITGAALTSSAKAFDCIAWCMSAFTGLCLKALMCITWTAIARTTIREIFSRCLNLSISPCTAPIAQSRLLPQSVPRNGIAATKGGAGTASIGSVRLAGLSQSVLRWCASNAGSLMRRAASRRIGRGSARRSAELVRCVAVVEQRPRAVYCSARKEALLLVQGGLVASNCDALRYGCMSRPIVREAPGKPPPRFDTQQTINELIRRQTTRRLSED